MATATVISTSDSLFANPQLISSNQGSTVMATLNPFFTGHVSPANVFKMRAWETVAGIYIFWMSFGDPNTLPPTLNPVINVTAIRMSRPRTV